MSITSLSDYDIENGKLTVSGFITLKWTDELLHWNDTQHGAVTRIIATKDEVWTPEIKQGNDAEVSNHFITSSVWVTNNGTAVMILAGDFIGYCSVSTLLFPIDKQTCYFVFLSTANDATELYFDIISNSIQTNLLAKHGEWNIDSSNVTHMNIYDDDNDLTLLGCLFHLNLSRRPLSILLYTCLPLALIASLNVMIYVVPVASGERVSFSVQILLTLIFFTSGISDRIPQNAIEVPLLSRAMGALTFLCSVNVAISVGLSRLASETIKPVSGCLKSLTRLSLYLKLGRRYKTRGAVRLTAVQGTDMKGETGNNKNTVTSHTSRLTEPADDIDITWLMVVDMFDAILFYAHLSIVVAGTVLGGMYIFSDVM